MMSLVLMAGNFLRQRRWPVLLLFLWILLTAAIAGDFGRSRTVIDDVVFHAQQQAIYICIFSAFLAADALHTERKSRRILLVLAKAVSRGDYLLAVLAGTVVLAVAYAVLSALCSIWLTTRTMLPSGPVWQLFPLVVAGALISASTAVFLSTFLNPYFATACTLAIFCAPIPFHPMRHAGWIWLPGFPMLAQYLQFSFRSGWSPNWMSVVATVLEAVALWLLASAIFERRDVAVPVE
jgi:ABC-type transport system involved in multi-copper enzyme maturation permease subunit